MKYSLITSFFSALACVVIVAACDKPAPQSAAKPAGPPTGHGHAGGHHPPAKDGVQAIDVYADANRIHILVAVSRDGAPALLHSRSEDGGNVWSDPVRVDAGLPPAHSPHRGMDPQIAAAGENLVAVWMSPGTDKWGGGPMATALSSDGGRTWQAGPNPADDQSTAGHGFIDIAAARNRFHLTWLDDRENQRGLRYTTSTDSGKSWSKNATIDPETCECCSNALVANPEGNVAILYRDKAPRDMGVAVSTDHGQQWRPPTIAGSFGWQFDGCPHSGGGIAFGKGSSLYAAVWTGQSDRAGVYFVTSKNLGESWSSPVPIAADAVHADLAISSESHLAIVWDAGRAIYGKASSDGGVTWTVPLRLSAEDVTATHPRVIFASGKFHVFWTEQKALAPTIWRTVALP